jgi:predicted helicase
VDAAVQRRLAVLRHLLRKYTQELHANEINLLAYYVAAVNIEATFHGLPDEGRGQYVPFDGIVLTDTFQMHEEGDTLDYAICPQNNKRVLRQNATGILREAQCGVDLVRFLSQPVPCMPNVQ